MSTQRVRLNLSPDGRYVAVTASQYDVGGQFEIALYDGADEYEIPSGAGVVLSGTNPNGNTFLYNYGSPYVSVSGNIVTVTTTEVMTTAAGNVNCEIRIEQGSSSVGSANFFIWVEEKVFPMDEVVTEDEHATILQAVNYLSQHTGEAAAAAERAKAAVTAVEDYSDMAKSWAVGPSGEGSYGTDENNAKYWAEQTATDVQKVIDYASEVETNTQEVAANTQTVADNTAQTDINARAASNSAAAAAASAKRAEDAADILTGGTLVATAQGDINPIDSVHDDTLTPFSGVIKAPVDGYEYYPYTRASLVYMDDNSTVENINVMSEISTMAELQSYLVSSVGNGKYKTILGTSTITVNLTNATTTGLNSVITFFDLGAGGYLYFLRTVDSTWVGSLELSGSNINVNEVHQIEGNLAWSATKTNVDGYLVKNVDVGHVYNFVLDASDAYEIVGVSAKGVLTATCSSIDENENEETINTYVASFQTIDNTYSGSISANIDTETVTYTMASSSVGERQFYIAPKQAVATWSTGASVKTL